MNDLRPLFSIVLLQLRKALDDRHQRQFPGPSGGEEGQDVEGGHGAQLVTKQHHPVRELSAVLVSHREQLSGKRLNHEARHEVLAGVLLGQHQEDGGLLGGEGLRVNGAVKTEDLLQLGIQEGVQPGQHCGHDGGHRLVGGVQRRPREPAGLVGLRQRVHQDLEPVFALGHFAGGQEVLHQLEDADDVPGFCIPRVLGRQILCQQKHNRCQQSLGRVVKECVLPVVGSVSLRVDDGLGKDFGVLFRLGSCGEIARVLPAYVHVVVDERQEVVPVGAGGVSQIDHRHLIAVVFDGDGPIVPGQVSFGV